MPNDHDSRWAERPVVLIRLHLRSAKPNSIGNRPRQPHRRAFVAEKVRLIVDLD
jgi:hypothetical protein